MGREVMGTGRRDYAEKEKRKEKRGDPQPAYHFDWGKERGGGGEGLAVTPLCALSQKIEQRATDTGKKKKREA